jgi:hypothetical protein
VPAAHSRSERSRRWTLDPLGSCRNVTSEGQRAVSSLTTLSDPTDEMSLQGWEARTEMAKEAVSTV